MSTNINPEYLVSERKRIGSLIKEKRLFKGFTMQNLADEVGINITTISKIEAGKWNFGVDTVNAIGVVLDFKVEL